MDGGSEKPWSAPGYGHRVPAVVHDPDLFDLLAKPLDLAGYGVTAAGTGAAAYALLAERHFDLVIVDVGIPDLEDLARGRRLAPANRPPVLCLTPCETLDRLVPELGSSGRLRHQAVPDHRAFRQGAGAASR